MELLVRYQLLFCVLTVVEQYVDDLLIARIFVLTDHHSMQASITIYALHVNICANSEQLSHRLHILVLYGYVEGSAILVVNKVELFREVHLSHLLYVHNVIGTSSLQNQFLNWGQVVLILSLRLTVFKFDLFLISAEFLCRDKTILALILEP